MKRLFLMLFCCLCLTLYLSDPVQAAEGENRCGANLTWELSGSTLYIRGTGPMDDYSEENLPPWQDQLVDRVVLSEGVTHIGDRAFANTSLYSEYSVEVPESLCSIGMDAFANTPLYDLSWEPLYIGNVLVGCSYVSDSYLEIREGTVGIADGAFKDQYDLCDLIVPDSVFRVGQDAFLGTQWYENQPDGLVYCGKVLYADKGGYNSYVYLDDGTTGIADGAFRESYNLSSIDIPDGVKAIGDYAFYNCSSLYDVSVNSYELQSIGASAFENCTGLYSVDWQDGLLEVGTAAFRGSAIQIANLPYSVISIGTSAYENCENLTEMEAYGELQAIGDRAFKNCKLLSNAVLGCNLMHIGEEAFADYYDRWWPFDDFRKPLVIQFDGDEPYIGENAFANVTVLGLYQDGHFGFTEANGWGGRVTWKENPVGYPTWIRTGSTSSTVSWAILPDDTLCLFGSEWMYPGNYTPALDECPFAAYANQITAVSVEPGITALGDYAFTNLYNVESVSFPADLKDFGKNSLKGTAWLENQPDGPVVLNNVIYCLKGNISGNVTIPEGVEVIGDRLFADCTEMTGITIPDTVYRIGDSAFIGCSGLTSVVIPESVTQIAKSAFSGCSGLTAVTVPDSVTELGTGVFAGCSSLQTVTIGNGVRAIDYSAFSSCTSLTQIFFGTSVSSFGRQAFDGCTALKTLTVPAGVSYIGECAFSGCTALEYVDLNQVSTMSFGVFGGCTSLKTVIYSPKLKEIPSVTFSGCSALTEFVIPDTVEKLGENCFGGCTSLKRVYIGSGVREVEVKPFKRCTALTSIEVSAENPWLDVDSKGVLYTQGLKELIDYPAGRIGSYTVPEGVTLIRKEAFLSCDGLTSIRLPDTLKTIQAHAFRYCTGLTHIVIPDSVTEMEGYMFDGCTGIRYAFLGSGLAEVTYGMFQECTSLKQVQIKEGPTQIGSDAFYNCNGLVYVEIPDSVTKIDMYAFASCDGLQTVYLGSGVAEIGYAAFSGCSKLYNLHIPVSLKKVGEQAFYATKLNKVTPKGHVSYAGTKAQWSQISIGANNDPLKQVFTIHREADQSYTEDGTSWAWTCTGCNGISCSKAVSEPLITVCAEGKTLGSYLQPGIALENCGEGRYLVLHVDLFAELSLCRDLYLDLNGYSLTGVLDTNGYQVYGMDTSTDGYTCTNMGSFFCEDIGGNGVVPVKQFKSDMTGTIKRYMTVETENGYTFHRFWFGLTKVTLRTADTGFGYKAMVCGDTMVLSQLDDFGFRLNLDGQDTVVTKNLEASCLEMGREYSLLLRNFQIRSFGATDVHAQVYLSLKDGTELITDQISYSMKTMLQKLDQKLGQLTTSQIEALRTMCQPYADIMKTWGIDALVNDKI